MDISSIEKYIVKFPLYQYAFIKPSNVEQSVKSTRICERTCRHYNSSWSCPPAVGSVDKCKEYCGRYTDLLVFSTVTKLYKKNTESRKSAQREHEKLTGLINKYMRSHGYLTYVLSSGSCILCDKCTFPKDYCNFPDEMFPCIESHGIIVSDLMGKMNMDYYLGENLFLLFSFIYFKDTGFVIK